MAMNRRFPRDFVLTAFLIVNLGATVFFAQEWSGAIASYLWSLAACFAVLTIALELSHLRVALSDLQQTISRNQ